MRKLVKIIPILGLVFLIGCTSGTLQKTVSFRNKADNQFEVINEYDPEGWPIRAVIVKNKAESWQGEYQGGKEKLEKRRELLLSIATDEAKKVCKSKDFSPDGSPTYDEAQKSQPLAGAGIVGNVVGILIADEITDRFLTDHDKLPKYIVLPYRCSGDPASKTIGSKLSKHQRQ